MSAAIKIHGVEATVNERVWSSDIPQFTQLLNGMRKPLSGADPNPDLTLAEEAVRRLGGRVVRFDESEYVDGRIY